MCGKSFQIFGVYIPRKYIEARHFYSCTSSPLKTFHEVLSITPYVEGNTNSPRQEFFKNLFPPAAK